MRRERERERERENLVGLLAHDFYVEKTQTNFVTFQSI
jgi:hypothetical protein